MLFLNQYIDNNHHGHGAHPSNSGHGVHGAGHSGSHGSSGHGSSNKAKSGGGSRSSSTTSHNYQELEENASRKTVIASHTTIEMTSSNASPTDEGYDLESDDVAGIHTCY